MRFCPVSFFFSLARPKRGEGCIEIICWIESCPVTLGYHCLQYTLQQMADTSSDLQRAKGQSEHARNLLLTWIRSSQMAPYLQKGRFSRPSLTGWRECPARLLTANRNGSRVIWRELQHQSFWLFHLCLCFWRTRFLRKSFVSRENRIRGDGGFYIEGLASPFSFVDCK